MIESARKKTGEALDWSATKDQQLHRHHPFFHSRSFRNVFCSCHSTSQQAPHLLLPRLLIITSVSSLDPAASHYLPEKSVDDAAASERAAALVQSVGKVCQKTTASQALHMWYVYHRIIVPRYIVCRVALKRPFRYMSEKPRDHAIRTYWRSRGVQKHAEEGWIRAHQPHVQNVPQSAALQQRMTLLKCSRICDLWKNQTEVCTFKLAGRSDNTWQPIVGCCFFWRCYAMDQTFHMCTYSLLQTDLRVSRAPD